ncbi:hypothetical protein [Almyronema epifaneia]|uniref:Uncharacterized protein n=1 Tax=Almyronema epifaneia S1 TaxID=2991925 RepID=A0ABW6I9G9_9CYAN
MVHFSTNLFEKEFDFVAIDRTVHTVLDLAAQDPYSLYLFFHRYTYFNAYASAMISRLASSIGLSRYLFTQPHERVAEAADRGLEIAAKILTAAVDEGTYENPSHRALAQLTLKTVGDYAQLSIEQRNQVLVPQWLDQLVQRLIVSYQGIPGNVAALVQGIGLHIASEVLGDREYALIDKVIRHDYAGTHFDRFLNDHAQPGEIDGRKFHPWCWIVIHSRYEGSGVEVEHADYALAALNLAAQYRPESEQQVRDWAIQGFSEFVTLQQKLFREIYRECLDLRRNHATKTIVSV